MALAPLDLGRYARPKAEHPAIVSLLDRLGVGPPGPFPTDLGGTMSLNLHLADRREVLRVHAPFVTRPRLAALRTLRAALADDGLVVGAPRSIDGRAAVRAGAWLAEAEAHVPHAQPLPTEESYVWLFAEMGRLHRHLAPYAGPVPIPVVSTYGPPSTLRRWLVRTRAAVRAEDPAALPMVDHVQALARRLEARWVPATALPGQVVHGDVRLGNVARTPDGRTAFLDFGFAARRPRIHDLAYSLSWIVLRPDDSGTGADFAWERRLPELVSAYEDGAHRALEPLERQALVPYLAAVPLALACVAGFTPTPVANLRDQQPFVAIAEWVLANLA